MDARVHDVLTALAAPPSQERQGAGATLNREGLTPRPHQARGYAHHCQHPRAHFVPVGSPSRGVLADSEEAVCLEDPVLHNH